MGANLLEATASKAFCEALLFRVEMWCARKWCEVGASAAAALVLGNSEVYAFYRSEQREWLQAVLVVQKLTENRRNGDRT